MRTRAFTIIVCLLALLCAPALADTHMYTFPVDDVPKELIRSSVVVPESDVTISFTFAGDCTLGCEAKFMDYDNTCVTMIREQGYDYPFKLWQFLFANDDFTVVNLEGPLTVTENLPRPNKTFVFWGPAEFTKVLSSGGVECVTLENNHSLDLGAQGFRETVQALKDEGVAYISADYVTVLEKDGVRVGMTSSQFTLNPGRRKNLAAQIEALKSVGCAAIIHNAHMGENYKLLVSKEQRDVADYARARGVTLLIGHHPHVVQGVHQYDDMLAVYSLGNFSFGGNAHPRDFDAVVASVEMKFTEGALASQQLTLWPAAISGTRSRNNFQPLPVTGEAAEKVIKKIQKSSNYTLSPYEEGRGAVQPIFIVKEAAKDGQ